MNKRQSDFITAFLSYAGKKDPTCYADIETEYLAFRDRVNGAFDALTLEDLADDFLVAFCETYTALETQAQCGIGFCAGAISRDESIEVFKFLYYGKTGVREGVQKQYLSIFGEIPGRGVTKIPCWHPDAPKPRNPQQQAKKNKKR